MTDENWLRKLAKSQDDKWIGGVCGGLGKYTRFHANKNGVFYCGSVVSRVFMLIRLKRQADRGRFERMA